MRKALVLLTLASCVHTHQPTRPAQETAQPQPACPASVIPTMADICDGRFTADGFLCVNCKGAAGCFDTADAVYCAQPNCDADTRCHKE